MTISRYQLVAGVAAAAASAAMGTPSIVRAQSAKAITIGYVPSTLFAPVFVAQERGYLKDAGFNATLTPIVAGQDAMALAAQSQLDVVTAGLSAAFFNAVNRNLDVRFVASTGYQPAKGHPSALMIRQDLWDAGAHDASALKGKNVGWLGNLGATSGYYVAVILRKYGLTLKDISPLNVAAPDQGVALDKKAIDAVFAAAPFTALFEQKKLAHIIGSVPPGIAGTGIFFGPSLLNDIPSATAVLKAIRRGALDVAGDGYYKPENLAAMSKYTNQPVDLIKTTDRYDFKPRLNIDSATLFDMQRVFISQGILTYQAPISDARLIARF